MKTLGQPVLREMPRDIGRRFDYLQFRLDLLSTLIDKEASAIFEPQFGVSVRQLRILRMTNARPGIGQSELAQLVALEKTIVSKLLSSLERKRLVRRSINSLDARRVNLRVTSAGLQIIEEADRKTKNWEKEFLSVLAPEELDALMKSIKKLILHASANRVRK